MSPTHTTTSTFTQTHASHLAGRITTDLRHSQRHYGDPGESALEQYRQELELLLYYHYVAEYHFGYHRDGTPVWGLRYIFGAEGYLEAESDLAGGIPLGHNVNGARYFNFLTFSRKWFALTQEARQEIERLLPFIRSVGILPGNGTLGWTTDRRFTAGGIAAQREYFGGAL